MLAVISNLTSVYAIQVSGDLIPRGASKIETLALAGCPRRLARDDAMRQINTVTPRADPDHHG